MLSQGGTAHTMSTESLNRAQVAAVEHPGPVIVLAGPGTGKTRVIVHRVSHLIGQRSLQPERVIAATFTVKAAEELRDRLAKIVTPDVAQRVRACTLHSLGASIVRRHADELGLPSRMGMIDAAQSRRILRGVIEDLSLFRDSRAEGLPTLCDRLLKLFESMAERAVLPTQSTAHAETMVHTASDEASRVLAAQFTDTAAAYGTYCSRRWERGRLTFSDFVLLPVLGMRTRPGLRAVLRAECAAFVVDEFQDCNAGQIELLRLLAGGSDTGGADVCVVGDDDQAIYAFRGADERAFERFQRIWTGATVLELSENYRSVRAIVGMANSIIERAGAARFKPDKAIVPTRPDPAAAARAGTAIVTLEQDHEDAEAIAAMILLDRARHRAATPNDPMPGTAVIARSHSDLDRVAAVLTLEGIPWSRRREASMLDDEGVQDTLAWIEWLLHPGATWAARRVMARPPYTVDPRTLADWEREHRSLTARARLEESQSAPPPLHEWLAARTPTKDEEQALATAHRVMSTYTSLRTAIAGKRADESLDLIIRATGTAHAELLSGRGRAKRISALVALLRLAREKQRDLDAPADLGAFWTYFGELRDADPDFRDLGATELLDADEELDREARGTTADDSGESPNDTHRVHLLTAHSAKGLEFDNVYVTRVRPPHGFPKSRSDGLEWDLPPGLVEQLDTRDAKTRKLDEERRLFYVACTRAQTRLTLLGVHKGKPSSAAANYLDELLFNAPGVVFSKTSARDVLRDASVLGLGVLARTALEATGLDFSHRQGAEEQVAEVVRQARVAAANALDRAARSGVTEADLLACTNDLSHAARMLAIASHQGRAPSWLVGGDATLNSVAERVAGLRAGAAAAAAAPLRLKPPTPPLSLSYTSLDQFDRCPRCWYLTYVLNLPGPDSEAARVGTIVHSALDRFVKAFAAADSEGAPKPGLNDLLRMAKRAMIDEVGAASVVEPEDEATVNAQLRSFFDRFHDERAQPVETERSIEFPYVVDGVTHQFRAKIDRVDLTSDNTYRVIDYKTGKGWASLKEPKKDDLQFGIYALALRHAHHEEGPLRGTAEYWLLATGERGTLNLADIAEAKVRSKIDTAVRAMLAGEFTRGKECTGPCGLF